MREYRCTLCGAHGFFASTCPRNTSAPHRASNAAARAVISGVQTSTQAAEAHGASRQAVEAMVGVLRRHAVVEVKRRDVERLELLAAARSVVALREPSRRRGGA